MLRFQPHLLTWYLLYLCAARKFELCCSDTWNWQPLTFFCFLPKSLTAFERATSLERFGVMSFRHQQLVEQLSPLLKFYVIHPKSVNQANAGQATACFGVLSKVDYCKSCCKYAKGISLDPHNLYQPRTQCHLDNCPARALPMKAGL